MGKNITYSCDKCGKEIKDTKSLKCFVTQQSPAFPDPGRNIFCVLDEAGGATTRFMASGSNGYDEKNETGSPVQVFIHTRRDSIYCRDCLVAEAVKICDTIVRKDALGIK